MAVSQGELGMDGKVQEAKELPLMVEGISKQYKGGVWANRDISLAISSGEVLGILGPNGAGKTTLVSQITTELAPTSGRISVFGVDVVSDSHRAKNMMGIVPQEATLFEYLNVYQTLRIFGKLRGLHSREAGRRADELIQDLHLQEYCKVLVERLSGGLRRRVMVGIAIIGRPRLIVLDEPTTGLDPQSRRDLWGLLRRYRDEGATVLITTHYMEEAEALCDRVGIIQQGRLLALDTVPRLREAHGYEFKVIFSMNGEQSDTQTLYGADDDELVERVRTMGVRQYSVARTNLEDVYLALTDGKESLNGNSN